MSFHAYLFFDGDCADAFRHYQAVFGGELQLIRFSDMPAEDGGPPQGKEDQIAHAALTVGDALLMGSDDPTAESLSVQGMQVSYSASDADAAKRTFEALSEGGEVTLPVSPTSWSPAFGMCVDRFGTPWMVGAAGEPQG